MSYTDMNNSYPVGVQPTVTHIKSGWVAQLRAGSRVVWERQGFDEQEAALTAAQDHVLTVLERLFA